MVLVLLASVFNDLGWISCHNCLGWYLANDNRTRRDDGVIANIGHNNGAIAYPAIFSDRNFFIVATLLLNRLIQSIERMLILTTQYMDTTGEHGIGTYGALANITLRPYIDIVGNFCVRIRK